MKWLFYILVFVYMCYRAVYGAKIDNLIVDPVNYGEDDFLMVGEHKTITCKPTNRHQKVDWVYPNGTVVKRIPRGRIFSQDHFVQSPRGRVQALMLTVTNAMVHDTGIYQCRSGDLTKEVSLCVLKPSEFINVQPVVAVDVGRSITLACQAKGDPEPRLTWTRNDESITDEDTTGKYKVSMRYNIEGFEAQLTITSLEVEDGGIYSCVSVQETELENCSHTNTLNITLNIINAPTFEEDSQEVYGRNGDEIGMTCAAQGFPLPTYRWFKVLPDNTLFEFDQKQITSSGDGHESILTVVVSSTTIGQVFKCQAINDYGKAEKYFTLMNMEKPDLIDRVELQNATADTVQLQVIWNSERAFPVHEFDVEYMEHESGNNRRMYLKESTWKDKGHIDMELGEEAIVHSESDAIPVIIRDLTAETEYMVRLRASNQAGKSPWSDPILVTTTEVREDEEEDEEITTQQSLNKVDINDGSFYGIFFAGGILVVAFVCMFAMRMVK